MSYNAYFGFSESPFQNDADLRFLFLTAKHEEVLAELLDFINARQGIALMIGDRGIGKTMLLTALVQRLPQTFQPIVLSPPTGGNVALMVHLARAMGLTLKEGNVSDPTPFADAARSAARQGIVPVIFLDDAHMLTDRHLKEIWLLTQQKLNGQHLLPIVLSGRQGLDKKLDSQVNQPLRHFIDVRIKLLGLTPAETARYLDHRLRLVGSSLAACFSKDCTGQLFAMTGGIPGRINQSCHQALGRAWQENLPQVTRVLLGEEKTALKLETQVLTSSKSSGSKVGALAAGALGVLLAGYLIYTWYTYMTSPSATNAVVAPTTTPPAPSREHVSSPPVSMGSTPAGEEADVKTAAQPAPTTPDLKPTPAPEPSQELQTAHTPPAPPADNQTAPPEAPASSTYLVSSADNLTQIAAKYYPDNPELGFSAILLANPQITDENFIYPGQVLVLPKINETDHAIMLKDHRLYALYDRYLNAALLQNRVSKLEESQVRFLLRETRHEDVGKIYRIFLGGYENKEDLQKAVKMAEKD